MDKVNHNIYKSVAVRPTPAFQFTLDYFDTYVYKNVVFQTQDEYSYFSVYFRLIILLNYP